MDEGIRRIIDSIIYYVYIICLIDIKKPLIDIGGWILFKIIQFLLFF